MGTAVGAAGSVVIESLQWMLDLGRFSSVDDVLVNAVGSYLAAWVAYPWWRRRARPQVDGRGRQEADAEPTSATA